MMGLRTKFNLVLMLVFTGGLIITGVLSYNLLQRNARAEVIQKAGIMMEAALSMRGYTVKQVKPLLEMQLRRAFLPQSVPAYAATKASVISSWMRGATTPEPSPLRSTARSSARACATRSNACWSTSKRPPRCCRQSRVL